MDSWGADNMVWDGLNDGAPPTEPAQSSHAYAQYDPMELDIDLDFAGWTNEVTLHPSEIIYSFPESWQLQSPALPGAGFGSSAPLDTLFSEDEVALPQFNNRYMAITGPGIDVSPMVPAQTNDDQGSNRLRSQLSLLADGSCGDELVFNNCEPSKAVLLHELSLEFGLNYSRDSNNRTVSIKRVATSASQSSTTVDAQQTRQSATNKSVPVEQYAPTNFISSTDASVLAAASEEEQAAKPSPSQVFAELVTLQPTLLISESVGTSPPLSVASHPHPLVGHESRSATRQNRSDHASNQQLSRQPSRSQRISDSIKEHVSTLKTSISKGGRKGPLPENGRRDMKALGGAGGACWRCKFLRRKCDPGTPCRCCLQSDFMPYLGDDAPLWPLLGCRRGPLKNSMPAQLLCPVSRNQQLEASSEHYEQHGSQPRRSLDAGDKLLLSSDSQRLSDMKAILEGATDKLSITDPVMKDLFSCYINSGRYRNRECLHRSYSSHHNVYNYSELLSTVAWELSENPALLPLLEIRSWTGFMDLLETACIYESEVAQTSLVMLSMICLRHCLEALRLNSFGLLSASSHESCSVVECRIDNIRYLCSEVSRYVDDLSSVIFNKDNMRDRRWWLSTFYSLYIQSYVRHAMLVIEKQLSFPSMDDVSSEDLTSMQYLHLAAVLFMATSSRYDPLQGGRHLWALDSRVADISVITETSVPEPHHSSARAVCEVDKWPESGITTSYQFLRRALQIGSLDFESERLDVGIPDASTPAGSVGDASLVRTFSSLLKTESSSMSNFPTSPQILEFPQGRRGHQTKHSVDSRYSMQSFTSASNASSESLTRTIYTDITSIYEYPTPSSGLPPVAEVKGKNIDPWTFKASEDAIAVNTLAATMVPNATQSATKVEGCFICDCCPKAPQTFVSSAELKQHEQEKPHACSQCKRRFRSPKEAERHMNAIHLKSDSWSCSALKGPLSAFYREIYDDLEHDICGFCGRAFLQAGPEDAKGNDATKTSAGATKDDHLGTSFGTGTGAVVVEVEGLVSHLESVHKFGECNSKKQFFRQDNFRQHLKNAHVAKPGKWLKVLEMNCTVKKEV